MGKMIVSPIVLPIVVVIVVVGFCIVQKIANKKWGYTPKREKELYEQSQKYDKK